MKTDFLTTAFEMMNGEQLIYLLAAVLYAAARNGEDLDYLVTEAEEKVQDALTKEAQDTAKEDAD